MIHLELDTVLVAQDGAIATLTLNRPDARNACNAQMCRDLITATDQIGRDDSVHLVLVRGAGTAFCAGMDIREKQGLSASDMLARRTLGFTAYASIESLPQPAMAVVHGPAYGGGLEIAAACDFVLVSSEAKFCYPEVAWGVVGATQRLPRLAGTRMAKELLFTSRVFDAAEAKEIGLANHVYPPAQLDAAVMEMAQKIAAAKPRTVQLTKQCIDRGVETTREGAMAIELLAIEQSLRQTDWKQALAGFGGKDK
ncbi:MAG: Enoyl-CoA hydratase [Paucimonas sp.]|nr:Enoyl-CoA hydratase [Paucimonas sp.]